MHYLITILPLNMAAKFVVFFGLVAAAAALPVVPVAHVAYEPEAPVHYQYQYSIHDGVSGDVKEQQEAREGDAVHGSYSFIQPDGVHRIVEYTADKEHGFNAVVRYEGTPIPAPTKVPVSAPVAYAPVSYAPAKVAYAPAKVYSPVSYSAPVYSPVSKVAYEAPLGHVTFSSPVASYHH
ncbi:unnamed protein product [Pieris brassicae]|uniref:Cuticle protein n=1 Tax=Pieris brassicae TaxID=7116 RepID=A0A9P0X941_PIEBR|nr:unnamed protein product [Pieris brassicae]